MFFVFFAVYMEEFVRDVEFRAPLHGFLNLLFHFLKLLFHFPNMLFHFLNLLFHFLNLLFHFPVFLIRVFDVPSSTLE